MIPDCGDDNLPDEQTALRMPHLGWNADQCPHQRQSCPQEGVFLRRNVPRALAQVPALKDLYLVVYGHKKEDTWMPQVAEKERKMRPSSPPDIIINLLRLIFRKRKVLYITIAWIAAKEWSKEGAFN